MAQSAVQPFIDARDRLVEFSRNTLEKYDKPMFQKKSKRIPTAKELGWADQTNMRKDDSSGITKKGVGTKTAAKKKSSKSAKKTTAKRYKK